MNKESNSLHSLEAEQSIISSLLLDNSSWDRVSDKLKPEHFYDDLNRKVFAEITRQINSGKSCDVITVYEAFKDSVSLENISVFAQYIPSSANLKRYSDIIIERFKSRQLLNVSGEIMDLAKNHSTSINERVDLAQTQLSKLVDETPKDEWVSAIDGMGGHLSVLEDRAEGKTNAMPTGLADLDDYFEGGCRPGELVIVGARPSMGKTALGLTISVKMAEKYTVGFISMEMSKMEVNDRLTAMIGGVSLSSVKRPNHANGLNWGSVVDAIEKARTLNLHISEQGGLNINQVRYKARNLKRLHGLNVLVVDYIGLMTGLDQRQNRNTQLEEISRGLKNLAKELGICVICLAQLNRSIEQRPEQMPMMSDLRDSGAIEQDADVIVFIKRPIMANPELGQEWKNYAKLSIAKNRQGRCGYINLFYDAEKTKFENWHGDAPSGKISRSSSFE